MESTPRILVASFGNTMAGDDVFGSLVTQRLSRMELREIESASLDHRPGALLDYLGDRQGLIIVDAVQSEAHPAGEVIDVDWYCPDRPGLVHDDVLSSHGFSVADQLNLAKAIGILPPQVRLIGAVIDSARIGERVTTSVLSAVEPVGARILHHIAIILNRTDQVHHA